MTDEEWRAFLERWNATPEEERNETLYFKPDTIMMEGRVVEAIHCGAKLRLKAGEGKLEESFLRPAQLRTEAEYEAWKAKLRAEGKIHTQICVICGTAFETRGKAKVCSEECQHTWKRQAALKRKKKGSGITLTSSMTEDERKKTVPGMWHGFPRADKKAGVLLQGLRAEVSAQGESERKSKNERRFGRE